MGRGHSGGWDGPGMGMHGVSVLIFSSLFTDSVVITDHDFHRVWDLWVARWVLWVAV